MIEPGVSVLIVDDDDAIRALVRMMLTLAGFVVVAEAPDGLAAIERAASLTPDVVVLDLAMPVMSGSDAAVRIREVSPDSKIIAFSANIDSHPPWADQWLDKVSIGHLPNLIGSVATG